MAGIGLCGAAVALLLIGVSITVDARATPTGVIDMEDRWPNFRCHPIYKSEPAWPGAVRVNENDWKWCLEQEKINGRCPKLCMASGRVTQMIYQLAELNDTSDPVVFSVGAFMTFMNYDNGYSVGGASGKAWEAKEKVRAGLELCKAKYQEEIAGWWMYMFDPCDSPRWKPIFDCIDSAIGCTRENTTPSTLTRKPEQRRRPYQ